MRRFRMNVTESRQYHMEYIVEGKNIDEALEKAEKGETIKEREISLKDVTDRHVHNAYLFSR